MDKGLYPKKKDMDKGKIIKTVLNQLQLCQFSLKPLFVANLVLNIL